MPTKFIRIDTDKLEEGDMQKILSIINKNPQKEKQTLVGKRFLRALMFAAEERKRMKKLKVFLPPVKPFKETITPKTIETIKKMSPPKPVEENLTAPTIQKTSTIQKEFKEVKYPLLVSKQGVLASALIQKEQDQLTYTVIEPQIDKKITEYVIKKLRGKKEFPEDLLTKIVQKAAKKFKQVYNEELKNKVRYYVYRDLKNFGKVDPLMHDHNIINITSNGKDKPLEIQHKTFGKLQTNIILTEKEIQDLINKVAEKTKIKVTKDNPTINTRLMSFRFQGTLGFGKVESKFIIKKEDS